MGSFVYWALFFAAGLAAILLAKLLDERDRRLRARSRAGGSVPPPPRVPREASGESD